MIDFLCLGIAGVFSLTAILIWNNNSSYDEVKKSERDQQGPWPKE